MQSKTYFLKLNIISLYLSAFFAAASPLMSNYSFIGPIGISDLFISFSLALSVSAIRVDKWFFYAITTSLIIILLGFSTLVLNDVLSISFFRASGYILITVMYLSINNKYAENFMSLYLWLAFFAAVLLIFQVLVYYLFGYVLNLSLPLKTYETNTLQVIDLVSQGFRTGGLFKEPSYFSIYISPAIICMAIRRKILFHTILVLASVLSTSSLGIAISMISYLFFFFGQGGYLNIKGLFIGTISMLIFFLVFAFVSDIPGIDRFMEIFITGGTLKDRVFPLFDVIELSGFFIVNPELHLVVSNANVGLGEWYNSFIYFLSMYGWIMLAWLFFVFYRLGFIFSAFFVFFLLSTHAFCNCYGIILILAFKFFDGYRSHWESFLGKSVYAFLFRVAHVKNPQ
jgi:hypothetical protein